jgi:nucleoid-associated protein YgaU
MTIEKGMKAGDYRVRIDDVESASGKVLTRAEVPFVMEDKSKPAPPLVVAQAEEPKLAKPATGDLAAPVKPAPAIEPAKPAVLASRDIGTPATPQAPAEATKPVDPTLAAPAEPAKPLASAEPVTVASAEATKPVVAATTKPAAQQVAVAPAAPIKEPVKPAPVGNKPDPAASAAPAKPVKPALQSTRDIGATSPAAATPQTPVQAAQAPAATVQPKTPGPALALVGDANKAPTTTGPVKPSSQAVIAEIKTTTIVHGDNLWRLSRKVYGHGIRYTWIYDANTTQIRDPHWIYPGQIFVMPENKEL